MTFQFGENEYLKFSSRNFGIIFVCVLKGGYVYFQRYYIGKMLLSIHSEEVFFNRESRKCFCLQKRKMLELGTFESNRIF